MKKIVTALSLALLCCGALAQLQSFLVSHWWHNGNQMCRYQNGTVLNVGINLCPLSIPG